MINCLLLTMTFPSPKISWFLSCNIHASCVLVLHWVKSFLPLPEGHWTPTAGNREFRKNGNHEFEAHQHQPQRTGVDGTEEQTYAKCTKDIWSIRSQSLFLDEAFSLGCPVLSLEFVALGEDEKTRRDQFADYYLKKFPDLDQPVVIQRFHAESESAERVLVANAMRNALSASAIRGTRSIYAVAPVRPYGIVMPPTAAITECITKHKNDPVKVFSMVKAASDVIWELHNRGKLSHNFLGEHNIAVDEVADEPLILNLHQALPLGKRVCDGSLLSLPFVYRYGLRKISTRIDVKEFNKVLLHCIRNVKRLTLGTLVMCIRLYQKVFFGQVKSMNEVSEALDDIILQLKTPSPSYVLVQPAEEFENMIWISGTNNCSHLKRAFALGCRIKESGRSLSAIYCAPLMSSAAIARSLAAGCGIANPEIRIEPGLNGYYGGRAQILLEPNEFISYGYNVHLSYEQFADLAQLGRENETISRERAVQATRHCLRDSASTGKGGTALLVTSARWDTGAHPDLKKIQDLLAGEYGVPWHEVVELDGEGHWIKNELKFRRKRVNQIEEEVAKKKTRVEGERVQDNQQRLEGRKGKKKKKKKKGIPSRFCRKLRKIMCSK